MLISKVGQAAWIICLEEMFCAEPGTGKAVTGLSCGLAPERGRVLAMAAWALGSTGAPLMVPGLGGFPALNVKEEGESVRELQHSALPMGMGAAFRTPYRQERSFDCFLLISPAQLCPLTASPGTQQGVSMGSMTSGCSPGCRWSPMAVTGHPWLSLITLGCHQHPQTLLQCLLLEVLFCVRSVAGPEGLHNLCLLLLPVVVCVCSRRLWWPAREGKE